MQNDDWVYYDNVDNFIKGNFLLSQLTAPTFYLQGLIAAAYSKIFGLDNLPRLTLIFSIGNFFIFAKILKKVGNLKFLNSTLISLIFFFNPLHFYSLLGFMTEIYFMFFL